MPDKLTSQPSDRTTKKDTAAPSTTTTTQAKPAPATRHIVAEEHGSDGSYTIWWSDGSVESGQGG